MSLMAHSFIRDKINQSAEVRIENLAYRNKNPKQ